MADSVGYTPGTGAVISTDQLPDLTHAQHVKIKDGTPDSTNNLVVDSNGAMYVRLRDNAGADATVPVSGTVTANPGLSSTGTITSVASSATSVTLKAANSSRKSLVIYNDSTAILYVATANVTATTSVFTFKLDPGGVYEEYGYTGIVVGFWATANGNARVTERT